jgi:DNA-binding NarL/FixJ family response regulator
MSFQQTLGLEMALPSGFPQFTTVFPLAEDQVTSSQIRILVVDHHPLMQEGLAAVIASQMDMALVGQASDCKDAVQQFRKLRPDITLMALRLPDMSGIEALIAIRSQFSGARVIMMATFEGDGPVLRALEAGASSCIFKDMPPDEIVDIVRQVHAGKRRLPEITARIMERRGDHEVTDREALVSQRISGGNRNRDIAYKLFIAEQTVRLHMKHAVNRLAACDRTESH